MKINPLIVFRKEFDGTGMLFNPDNGDTFALNRTAAFLWEKLNDGLSGDALFDALKNAASDLPPNARQDVDAFVADLLAHGYAAQEDK